MTPAQRHRRRRGHRRRRVALALVVLAVLIDGRLPLRALELAIDGRRST